MRSCDTGIKTWLVAAIAHIRALSSSPVLWFLIQPSSAESPERQQVMEEYLSCCCPHSWLRLSSVLLVSRCPSPGCCRHFRNKQETESSHSLSSLSLSLSLYLSASLHNFQTKIQNQINKKTIADKHWSFNGPITKLTL